jgi:hypothetical protein
VPRRAKANPGHVVGEGGGARLGFRTFQIDPKDLSIPRWQAELAGVAAALQEGHAMSEQIEERPSRASDIVGMVVYSILVPLLLLMWVYIPA